jgi:hypothetical protein
MGPMVGNARCRAAAPCSAHGPPRPVALADATRPPHASKVAPLTRASLAPLPVPALRGPGHAVCEPRGGGTARVERESNCAPHWRLAYRKRCLTTGGTANGHVPEREGTMAWEVEEPLPAQRTTGRVGGP